MTPDANDLCVFAIRRGKLENRIDPHFCLPKFQAIIEHVKARDYTQLGKVAAFSKETTDFREFADGKFDYLEISGVAIGTNTYKTVVTAVADAPSRAKMKTRKGDIVISTTRPHRGAIAEICDNNIIASTGFSIIREIDSSIHKKWLLYVLMSNICLQQMLQRSSGGNYPAIIEDEIKNIYIPIINYPRQLDMVEKLEEKLNGKNQKLLKAEKMIGAFETDLESRLDLTSDSNNKLYYAIRLSQLDGVIDAKRYMSVKKENETALSEYCEIVDEKENVSIYGNQIVDWIRIDDLPNNPVEIETVRTVTASAMEGSFFKVQQGDILVARLGPTILNKKTVMVRSTVRTTVASAEFLVLRCKEEVDPEAVMAVLKTPYYQKLMYSHARGSTPSRYRLNRDDALQLPFPDIRPVQTEIAKEANRVRNEVKRLRTEAEEEWQAAKLQFEKELLGE